MSTATVPSTPPAASRGLAGRGNLLRRGSGHPASSVLEATFDIAPRDGRAAVPASEARRVGATRRTARTYLAHHGVTGIEFPVAPGTASPPPAWSRFPPRTTTRPWRTGIPNWPRNPSPDTREQVTRR